MKKAWFAVLVLAVLPLSSAQAASDPENGCGDGTPGELAKEVCHRYSKLREWYGRSADASFGFNDEAEACVRFYESAFRLRNVGCSYYRDIQDPAMKKDSVVHHGYQKVLMGLNDDMRIQKLELETRISKNRNEIKTQLWSEAFACGSTGRLRIPAMLLFGVNEETDLQSDDLYERFNLMAKATLQYSKSMITTGKAPIKLDVIPSRDLVKDKRFAETNPEAPEKIERESIILEVLIQQTFDRTLEHGIKWVGLKEILKGLGTSGAAATVAEEGTRGLIGVLGSFQLDIIRTGKIQPSTYVVLACGAANIWIGSFCIANRVARDNRAARLDGYFKYAGRQLIDRQGQSPEELGKAFCEKYHLSPAPW